MAARKTRTDAQKDRAKDQRLQRKYGITLARQNELRQQQDNRCKTCRVEFSEENPPCTDHFHYRIITKKIAKKNWHAAACLETTNSTMVIYYQPTKAAAIAEMRRIMAPKSVRGLLCRKCNRGLVYIERFFDAAHHPENLLPIIEYLRNRLTNR